MLFRSNSDLDVVRVDRVKLGTVSPVALGPIDWNFDGDTLDNDPGDINFNGKSGNSGESTPVFDGSNDFLDIIARYGLQQIDVSANVFGLSRGVLYRDLLNPGDSELLTANDIGTDEIGTDEIGTDEIGTDEIGTDEIGTDEIGTDEIGLSDPDETQATLSGGNAPSGITAQVFGQGSNKSVLLKWTALTGAIGFTIIRSATIGTTDIVASDPPTVISVPPGIQSVPTEPAPNYLDLGVKNNTRYRYTILASFQDPAGTDTVSSGPSEPVFITFN